MKPFYLGIDRSRADTAGNKDNFFLFKLFDGLIDQIRRTAQRSHKVLKGVPRLQLRHGLGGCADRLENDRDGSLFPVIITDCQRNPLACLVLLDDNELAGLTVFCHPGRLNDHTVDVWRQLVCIQNLKHVLLPPVSLLRSKIVFRSAFGFSGLSSSVSVFVSFFLKSRKIS